MIQKNAKRNESQMRLPTDVIVINNSHLLNIHFTRSS